jgi:hypothetical protein
MKKRRNVERVWAALEDMRARKEVDFSLASVARGIERLGFPGPKYQSLRNAEGADFRALIDAYRQTHGKAPTGAREDEEGDDDLPLAIVDPRLQHRVRVLLRQVRALQDRNRILHDQLLKGSIPMPTLPAAAPTETGALSAFTSEEIHAVKHFAEQLASVGLRADDETGCILELGSGREIAPPYFLDALRRITSQS